MNDLPKKRRGRPPKKLTASALEVADIQALMNSTPTGVGMMEELERAKQEIGNLSQKNLSLLRKLKTDPNVHRDGLERAVSRHGEHPAQSLMDMAHEKDQSGNYVLEPKERRLILSEILGYLVPKQKALEVKEKTEFEFNITVKQYGQARPEKQAEVIDVKEEKPS